MDLGKMYACREHWLKLFLINLTLYVGMGADLKKKNRSSQDNMLACSSMDL